jgi:septum formation protein
VSALPLVLASRSPQRRAILTQLALPYRVVEPEYEERALPLEAIELVETHARGKARSVDREPSDGAVLGVDTAVVIDGDVLGKPVDAAHAREMLERLSGREHLVVSGLTLRHDEDEITAHASTAVRFRALPPSELDAYVHLGEWQGRAGGYAIQGRGAALVESVTGDYANVVGLPVALLVRVLLDNFPADTIFPPAPRR